MSDETSIFTHKTKNNSLEMDSNQSGAVGGIILGVFQGSLTHLGASRRLQAKDI